MLLAANGRYRLLDTCCDVLKSLLTGGVVSDSVEELRTWTRHHLPGHAERPAGADAIDSCATKHTYAKSGGLPICHLGRKWMARQGTAITMTHTRVISVRVISGIQMVH